MWHHQTNTNVYIYSVYNIVIIVFVIATIFLILIIIIAIMTWVSHCVDMQLYIYIPVYIYILLCRRAPCGRSFTKPLCNRFLFTSPPPLQASLQGVRAPDLARPPAGVLGLPSPP